MHLFAGSSHPALATSLSKELGVPLGSLVTKSFSCGERYVRFGESIRGKDVYILQTAGKHPNEDLMELFLLCQAAKLRFAKTVYVLLPHIRSESIRGKDVYILQTAGKHPNEDLMELFLLCQAAKLSFAKTVHVLLPHMPYARQDRVSEPREPISAKLTAHLLEEA